MNIDILNQLGTALQSVQNPTTYLGGEFGQIVKNAPFTFGMAFPDLYGIGMSNQAIKIIYNGLNSYENIACERVFAIADDFEALLKEHAIPLYTLETGIPLHELDMLGFSIGYEMGITTALGMLELGKVPIFSKDRTEADPIVIAGGCGVTNPAPLGAFFDAIFIGEAENEMFDLIARMAEMKKNGAKRAELLQTFIDHPSVWVKGKKAVRAIKTDFGQVECVSAFYPLPSVKPVQDHGVIEIMRGCPNGCRFCHAGEYYKPQRMKNIQLILDEAEALVKAGYREISLTSLSSGDYANIDLLLEILTEKYRHRKISFQLPSLKVSSFTLPVLESLSQTRRSGLTFAVETPVEKWQFSLNKEVYEEKLFDIIMNAKKRGWNKAKFYFMVGLPVGPHAIGHDYDVEGEYVVGAEGTEEREIVDFMLYIQSKTKIQCNVNIGTFIPKPHTAYQWAGQLTREQSREKLFYIRNSLPKGKFRTSTHNQFVSFIEGLISRGDEKIGELIYSAYKKGCKLDAWEDHINKPAWQEAIEEIEQKYGLDIEKTVCSTKDINAPLPWDDINLGAHKSYYKREWERSLAETRTTICSSKCTHHCGICNYSNEEKPHVITKNITEAQRDEFIAKIRSEKSETYDEQEQNIPVLYRAVFTFKKQNGSEYLPHLALQENFHKAFLRSELPIMYTNGFNPLPRFELASSLSLGMKSNCEVASIILRYAVSEADFKSRLQNALLPIIELDTVFIFPVSNKKKRESLATLLWGSKYCYKFLPSREKVEAFLAQNELYSSFMSRYNSTTNELEVIIPFKQDRPFRDAIIEYFDMPIYKCVDITKLETFSKKGEDNYCSYFEIYKTIAEEHKILVDE